MPQYCAYFSRDFGCCMMQTTAAGNRPRKGIAPLFIRLSIPILSTGFVLEFQDIYPNKEEITMALKNLFGKKTGMASAACGTACGSGGRKPTACGSACGSGDKKPTACGTACGSGDKK